MATLATVAEPTSPAAHGHGDLRALALATLGVVFGDIGTSPLYTMREAFGHARGTAHATTMVAEGFPAELWFWALPR